MPESPNHAVRELGATRLKLRGDLIFTPHTSGGQVYYVVEDLLNSRFFRIGHAESTFLSLLDGRTSIQEALSQLSSVLPAHRLSESDAAGLCRWLIQMDLAHTGASSQPSRLADRARHMDQRQRLAGWNPLVFRLPIVRPDRWFASIVPLVGWLFRPLAVAAWLSVVIFGAYTLLANWERFTASSRGVFAPDNWLWLVVCWVGLKLVHESAHGVACKRHGGDVRELGILFILFAPLAYVDVTSSWRFRSRWQRIQVAAAGMYVEMLLAAVAAVVWSLSGSSWLENLCFNVIVMATVGTVLFNANPLMKFDGYYILSDGLGMPNLYVNGQLFLRYWARRYLLGIPAALPAWTHGQRTVIGIYGVASFLWRIVVCTSLTIAAVTLFHGAGIVLACLALVLWFGLPVFRFAKYFFFGRPGEQPCRVHFLATAGTATAVGAAILGLVPWPGARHAPAVVEYAPHTVVRADSAGFVREIHVQSSQQVRQGQLLVVLENRELSRELADLEFAIRQSEIRGRQHEQQGELAAEQAEQERREALRSQLAEKRARHEQLAVRAPRRGKIVCRDLAALRDTYLKAGDAIASIGTNVTRNYGCRSLRTIWRSSPGEPASGSAWTCRATRSGTAH